MLCCAHIHHTSLPPLHIQAASFFSEANAAAAAAAEYAKHEAALARRVAQLPRPVMTSRSDSSITITVDKRGAVSDDRMAVSWLSGSWVVGVVWLVVCCFRLCWVLGTEVWLHVAVLHGRMCCSSWTSRLAQYITLHTCSFFV